MSETLFLTVSGLTGMCFGVLTLEGVIICFSMRAGGSFRNPEVSVDMVLTADVMLIMGLFAVSTARAVSIRPVETVERNK